MKGKPVLITFCIFLIIIAGTGYKSVYPDQDTVVIEDFNKSGAEFFSQWENRDSSDNPSSEYYIDSEGDKKFLRATTQNNYNLSIQIGKLVNAGKSSPAWYIYNYPVMSWEWRAHILPDSGNELKRDKNDSGAGLYVLFQRKKIPFAGWKYQPVNWIKYVWSTTLPVGTVIPRKKEKAGVILYEGRCIVVASGKNDLGKWLLFRRNVLADYIRYFGQKPLYNPIMVAILTDSNSTKSRAVADYANIKIHSH